MKDLAIVLGIRPDVIRASKILKLLENQNEIDFDFLWSGQHYSENMKDTFFTQLNVPSQILNSALINQTTQLLFHLQLKIYINILRLTNIKP